MDLGLGNSLLIKHRLICSVCQGGVGSGTFPKALSVLLGGLGPLSGTENSRLSSATGESLKVGTNESKTVDQGSPTPGAWTYSRGLWPVR